MMSLWLRVSYYQLHFERPYKGRIQHYIGFAQCDLDPRLENHRQGRASAITKAAIAECIQLGKLPAPENLRLATWQAERPDEELPHARLHDLRHIHATTPLLAGVPVQVIAARLGHADPSITCACTPT
jgi:integrase